METTEGKATSDLRCKWKKVEDYSGDVRWETECDEAWQFTEGGIKDNNVNFCPYCGKQIKAV